MDPHGSVWADIQPKSIARHPGRFLNYSRSLGTNFLTKKSKNGVADSSVSWNFQKYLIDEDGFLVEVISPRTQPDDIRILQWINNPKS